MPTYELWQFSLRISRPLFLLLMLSLGVLCLSAPGRDFLDRVGAHYLAQRDQEVHDLSRRDPAAAWRKLTAMGSISVQHRYAELKTQVLRSLLASTVEPRPALDESHWQWAKKNARDVDLHLALSRYWQTRGAPEKALVVLEELAARRPEHEALSLTVIDLALALGRNEIAQQQIQRYVQQGQLLQWTDWPLLTQLKTQQKTQFINNPEAMALLSPTDPAIATQATTSTLPMTAEWLALRTYYGEP